MPCQQTVVLRTIVFFVYLFIEALADAGVQTGLPREMALKMAAQTVVGAGQMVLESQQHPGVLKDQVCSPGGSTIAGVASLEEHAFRGTVMGAVHRAYKRTQETRDGSFFVAQEKGLRTQKQWLAFYAQSQGTIWVDGGAAEALSKNGKSLLLSGVVEVEGNFSYHDIVTVADKETGQSLGKGRVQFGVSALEDMLRSQKVKGVLIHRDDWISITPEIQLLFTEF